MLVELITPLLIASAPITLDLVIPSYDHVTQVSAAVDQQSRTMSTTTFNGTQTFDFTGRPFDADSDKDADPY